MEAQALNGSIQAHLQNDSQSPHCTTSFAVMRPTPSTRRLIYQRHPYASWRESDSTTDRETPSAEDHSDKHKFCAMKCYLPGPVPQPALHNSSAALTFTSEFDSGNLLKAFQVGPTEYALVLQYDTETTDYCHWFNFRVQSHQKGQVRFHILNMMRPEPLTLVGMRPIVYTETSQGKPGGDAVTFATTDSQSELLDVNKLPRYTLSFSYTFTGLNDTVHFAYAYPYTYPQLQRFLERCRRSPYARQALLTKTLAGNDCPYLVIGDDGTRKRAVVFTGRVHPGETPASYMIEGVVEFLLSDEPLAQRLRNVFVFYIVPMLNPDGVRHGNYRCSALGVDLNRRWNNPNKVLHPTIYYTKKLIANICQRQVLAMFCDFHGHSKLKHAFMYGCQRFGASSIPALMTERNPHFSFAQSNSRITRDKESTARVTVYREFRVAHSYTLECSMFGSQEAFTPDQMRQIGTDLAQCCWELSPQGRSVSNPLTAVLMPSSSNNLRTANKAKTDFRLLKPNTENFLNDRTEPRKVALVDIGKFLTPQGVTAGLTAHRLLPPLPHKPVMSKRVARSKPSLGTLQLPALKRG